MQAASLLHPRIIFVFLSIVLTGALTCAAAQEQSQRPSPTPKPQSEEQEPIKVFTEEVRLPVVALDQFGHYDPTLEADDILVLENGVPQQIKSVRHVPANVLLVLDTGGEFSGLSRRFKTNQFDW